MFSVPSNFGSQYDEFEYIITDEYFSSQLWISKRYEVTDLPDPELFKRHINYRTSVLRLS